MKQKEPEHVRLLIETCGKLKNETNVLKKNMEVLGRMANLMESIGIMMVKYSYQESVRGHHSPAPITPIIPATSDSPQYIPPHKRPNLHQLLET